MKSGFMPGFFCRVFSEQEVCIDMIYLFTDFGYSGPYVGEVRAILNRALTYQQVVDLMHDAPRFNPRASAYLLAALSSRFEYGDICLAVVDPGVGDPHRRAIMIEADGVTYVGPDNGLLSVITKRATKKHIMEIVWRPDKLTNSFHGRDLFAPVIVKAALRESFETSDIPEDSMVGSDWPDILSEVVYIDHYGNIVTGVNAKEINSSATLTVCNVDVSFTEVFYQAEKEQLFWHVNSMGLVEIASNKGDAASQLQAAIGMQVSFTDLA